MKSVSSLILASLLVSFTPAAHAMEPEGPEAALTEQVIAAQKRLEEGIEHMTVNLAGFVEVNPELAELPKRFATAQAKLLKNEFKGKNFSLDELHKKSMLATAQLLTQHALKAEEVNKIEYMKDFWDLQAKLGFEALNKFAPPVKASAKTAARLWANADWASVLPGLQQVSHSLMTCLSTVLANYEAEAANLDDNQSEDEDEKVEADQAAQEAASAEAELQAMLAALGTTSSTGTDLELP